VHQIADPILKFDQNATEWRKESRWLWGHITLVNATVLGFSVTTTQIRNLVEPNIWLIFSWISLLFSILLGFILLKKDQDIRVSSDIKSFEFNYNLKIIEDDFNKGNITQEKRNGLLF
jgi:hypothetical protein